MSTARVFSPTQIIPNCKQGALRAIRYNVDGEFLLTCGSDRTIKLWSCAKTALLSTYQGHSGDVLDVRGSCDNSQLCSGSTDKNVFLWDVAGSRLVRRWRGHNASVTCVQFNENSTCIVSGSQDNSVKLWDVRAGRNQQKEIQSLEEAKDTVTAIAISDDSILVGSADGYARLYDLRQGKMSVDVLPEAVTSVAISRDKASHLVSVADETVKLLDRENGQLLATYKGHSGPAYKDYKIEVAFDHGSGDKHVFAASPKGKIYVWDLISEKIFGTCDISKESDFNRAPVTSISAHPQQGGVVVGGVGGGVYFFFVEEDRGKEAFEAPKDSDVQMM